METINILISLNQKNTTDYLILLESLIHTNKMMLYIIGGETNLQFYKEIATFLKKYNIPYEYYVAPTCEVNGLDKAESVVIFSPYILPEKLNKIIYLNSHILVKAALTGLWNFNIENFFFAACEDRWISRGVDMDELERVHTPETEIYFNADVLVLNLSEIRRYLEDGNLKDLHMQDGEEFSFGLKSFLNKYFSDKIAYIAENKYNMQLMSYRERSRKEKYNEAIIINYEKVNMLHCDREDIYDKVYDLWWNYAQLNHYKNVKARDAARRKKREAVNAKISFSMDYLRFVLKKLFNKDLSIYLFPTIQLLNRSGLWNAFYFAEKKRFIYEKKYRELTTGYKTVQVHCMLGGGAAIFFLTIICYKILRKDDEALHIFIPSTFLYNCPIDIPDFYVHNEAVLRYMDDAYVPRREEKEFLRYILSKYFYDMDFTQFNKFSPVIYEDADGTYEELEKINVIKFSETDIEKGEAFLQKYGIGDEFVCIAPRSNDYKKVYLRTVGCNDYLNCRNGSIESYLKAVEVIKAHDLELVQMGKINRKSFPLEYGILNFSEVYDEFLDLYLFSKCKFVIGDGSGIMNIASMFVKPKVLVNLELLTTSNEIQGYQKLGKDILLPVKYWSEKEKRYLKLKEQLALEAECKKRKCRFEERVIELGYKGVSNSDEEIGAAAREMIDYIINGKEYTEEEIRLQDIGRNLIEESAQKFKMRYPRCNFSVDFLKMNPWYLE